MLQLIVDRRGSGVVTVQLAGASVHRKVFVPGTIEPYRFASFTLAGWTAARIVPYDRLGYPIEDKMIREIQTATGVVMPSADDLVPIGLVAKHLLGMAAQAVLKM